MWSNRLLLCNTRPGKARTYIKLAYEKWKTFQRAHARTQALKFLSILTLHTALIQLAHSMTDAKVCRWADSHRHIEPPLVISLAGGQIRDSDDLVHYSCIRSVPKRGVNLSYGRGFQPYFCPLAQHSTRTPQYGMR